MHHQLQRLLTLLLLPSCLFFTTCAEETTDTTLDFEPRQVVLAVPDVESTARWYVDKLDFTLGKPFEVPAAGLTGRLVNKGDFEIMFMRGEELAPLPEGRRGAFDDLKTAGTKRIAFEVPDLEAFAREIRKRGVEIDVAFQLFEDADSGVRFHWLVVSDPDGNLVEFMEH